jgi:hypothetical protein
MDTRFRGQEFLLYHHMETACGAHLPSCQMATEGLLIGGGGWETRRLSSRSLTSSTDEITNVWGCTITSRMTSWRWSSLNETWTMTLSSAALTWVEKNSRPYLAPPYDLCKAYHREISPYLYMYVYHTRKRIKLTVNLILPANVNEETDKVIFFWCQSSFNAPHRETLLALLLKGFVY